MFHGTTIPACIIVLKKNRNGNSSNILFIDASKEFIKGKNQNSISDEQIDKIISAYVERKDVDKYAHVASLDEVKKNDYNLNIPRYVDTFEEEAPVDLNATFAEIAKAEQEEKAIDEKLNEFFKELGLEEKL